MTAPRTEFTADQQVLIEVWQRSAMEYGWRVGRSGLPTPPDPLFSWRDGYPEVIAEGSIPESWTGERGHVPGSAQVDDREFDLPGDEPPDPPDEE